MRFVGVAMILAALSGCAADVRREPSAKQAEPTTSLEVLCTTIYSDCRKNLTVRLRAEDSAVQEIHLELSYPPVQDGELVTIFPGETIWVEGEWVEGRLTKLRSVPGSAGSSRALAFKFQQVEGKAGMMLSVTNPFDMMIKYRLGMQPLGRDGVFKTSSCPVIPGGHGFEHWPEPIFQLVVMDIEAVAEGAPMTCD